MFPSFYFINSNVAKMLQLLCSEKAEKGAQRRDIMEEDKILIFFFGAWSVEIPNSSKPPLPPARSTNLTIPGMLTRSRRRSMAFQGPSSDRPDDAEADVGILNVDVAAAAGASIAVAVDNDTNNDDDTLDLSTSLYDVHVNLQYVTSWSGAGSCCASDRADGTTTTPALPSTLGLRIDRVGDLPLPLSDFHAKLIKSNRNSREIEEKTHHGVHSVPSKRIHIHNPAWKVALEQMVRTVAYKLGVAPKFLSAELKMLLLMEKGSRIDRCSIDSGGATVERSSSSSHRSSREGRSESSSPEARIPMASHGRKRAHASTLALLPASRPSHAISFVITATANSRLPRSKAGLAFCSSILYTIPKTGRCPLGVLSKTQW
jgi:hypothetical protein